MRAMVVGADRLGNIPGALGALGIEVCRHITGRASAHQKTLGTMPKHIDLLILFTDFLSHNVMRSYRSLALSQGIPVVACRRSSSCLIETLGRTLGLPACGVCQKVSAGPG
jgi:hypothetical protein